MAEAHDRAADNGHWFDAAVRTGWNCALHWISQFVISSFINGEAAKCVGLDRPTARVRATTSGAGQIEKPHSNDI
jgi:hypothetical protein